MLSPVSGLGKLSKLRYNKFCSSVLFLLDCVNRYQKSTPSEWQPPNLKLCVKWLQQVLDQLCSVHMSFCHIEFVVWDLQRVWSNLWAILDYMKIYKPCMDGLASSDGKVANTIGMFTSRIHIAQDMFGAGLPCWLIWPSTGGLCSNPGDQIRSDQNPLRIRSDNLPAKFHILGQVVWSDPSLTYFWSESNLFLIRSDLFLSRNLSIELINKSHDL